jgi:hypothetical protein
MDDDRIETVSTNADGSTNKRVRPGTVIYRVDIKKGIVKATAKDSMYSLNSDGRSGWVGVEGVAGALSLGTNCSFDPDEAVALGVRLRKERIALLEQEIEALENLVFWVPE